MIEDSKQVKKIEAKAGGKSGTYWTVTWTDGKFDTIFDDAIIKKCEEAMTNKLAVHYTKEKQGKYWNIRTLELVSDELPPPQEPKMLPEHKEVINKAREAVKEPIDRDSRIDQAVIFKAIVEMLSSQVDGKSVLEKEFPQNFKSFKEWALIYMKSKM